MAAEALAIAESIYIVTFIRVIDHYIDMPRSSTGLSAIPQEVIDSLARLGARLRACRIERGFSLSDMAGRMFCSINTYRALEAGKPTSSLGSLCNALWLLGQLDGIERLATVPAALAGARSGRRKAGRAKLGTYELDF
jgi:DNA-binding XRE family transcriptional regulator